MKKLTKDQPCWCKSGKLYGECHMDFDKKIEMYRRKFHKVPPREIIKNEAQLQGMRESSKINIAVLDYVAEHICAGMTTEEIDQMVYQKTTAMGGIPAPLNYEGFPKSVCTSINEQVCHGIPSNNVQLIDGDIVNVDCSTIYNGYFQIHPGCSVLEMFPKKPEARACGKRVCGAGLTAGKTMGTFR